MSQKPRLLVRGPTIDFNDHDHSQEHEREFEKMQFIRHDTRTPSPTGDYSYEASNRRQREFSRMKKGDVELLQMVNAGYATASLLVDRDKTSDKLTAPEAEPSPSSTPFRRLCRSAAKTIRQTKDQISVDQVDTATIINDLISLSQNSPSGASPLHYAQTSRSFPSQVTNTLIDELKIDINITDNDGDTPLHWAVTHSHLENIEELISRGADEQICNQSEEAPIHLAIKSGKTDAARIFFCLKCDSQILYSYRGRNYLHLACEENNLEMVQLILKSSPKGRPGADILDLPVPLVTLLDHDNLTPIHTAAKKCDYKILDLLLHQVEDAEQKESTLLSESREGFTPLHYSVDAGNLNNVKLLLRHGASPLTASRQQQISSIHLAAITSNTHNEILTELIMWTHGYDPTVVDIRDAQDRSPLHYSATYNHIHSASILHNYGANLNSIDRDGNTPLIVAASKGANKVLQFLLEKGADVTAQNHKGHTALLVSLEEGHWKTARELLTSPDEESKSVLVVIPDDTGQTPLHVICKGSGDYKTMHMLLGLHADVNMHDRNRRIPLHFACHYGSYPMGHKLLQEVWGSMLNDVDYRGHTSLHMASIEGHYDLIKLLLQKGAHITRSLNHDSAFSLACKHGHLKCAQLLYKTDNTMLNWQNTQGQTALHLAAARGQKDTVLWLLDINSLLLWDNTQKSFADIAIERKEQSLVSAVLDHARWCEVMELCSPAAPPPFVSLVKFLPDLAKVILERAITKSSEPRHHKDYYERVNFKFLTSNTAQEQTHRTLSAVSRQQQAKRNMPKGMSNTQTKRWTYVTHDSKPVRPVKKSLISRIRSHYTLNNLLKSRYVYEESSLYAVHTMIEHYRIGLLTHPVTKKYLDYKWRTYGRIYYSISILPFILFLFLLTTEIFYVYYYTNNVFLGSNLVARSNSSCSEFLQFNLTKLETDGYVDAAQATANFFWDSNLRVNGTRIFSDENLRCQCHPLFLLDVVMDRELYIIFPLLIATLACLLLQIIRIIKQPILYWFSAINLFELATLLVTLFIRDDFGLNIDRSALALFLGYGALFLQFRRYSWSGLYVTMFLEVISSMIKAILVFLPVLFAYVIIFFLMTSPIKGFSDILVSIVRIPVMLVGELDFYDSFLAEAECYRNKYIVYFILTLFIFGITISLANLLIGLAVGDIDNILKQAVVSKSIEQVNWLTEFELGPIFPLFKRWTQWDYLMVYPNRKRHLFSKIVEHIDVFGIFSQTYTSQDELNSDITDPNLLFLIGLKEENNNLKMQLQSATDEISNLQTSLNKVFAVVQKMDQKMDSITPPLDETQRTLPRSPVLDKRLKASSNSQ